MTSPDAEIDAAAENLARARVAADAEYRRRLAELHGIIGQARAAMSEGRAACLAGLPADDPIIRSALEWAEQAARFVELAGFLVAKSAVLTGRWPADREAEAHAICADEDRLYAFLDAMEKVPVGFVDAPASNLNSH